MGTRGVVAWFTFTLGLVAVFTVPASGLQCYQCDSTSNAHLFQCNEFLTDDIDIVPVSCDNVYGAKYCIKQVGRFEGGVGTKRFCSSANLGDQCNYVKYNGDELQYRTCVYTCSGDGCNPAVKTMPSIMTLALSTSIIFYHLQR